VSPSIATLAKLSESLDVPMSDLFSTEEDDSGTVYFPTSKRQKVQGRRSSANYMYELLTPGRKRRMMQPVIVSVDGKNYRFRLREHSGEQFVYLLEGEMEYVIGDQVYSLQPGDALYFDARVPHGPKLQKQQQARYLAIFSQL
jgi:mannose-6-phosphate isomerase-like protein (cupin superfamily)